MKAGISDAKRILFDLGACKSQSPKSGSSSLVSGAAKSILDPRLRKVLASKLGIQNVFHMQDVLLEYILSSSSRSHTGDVVLCAPTGSGKTLAYALPIVQDMLDRRMPHLRAIIVVPTRDLANQVFSVFSTLTKPFGIFTLSTVGSSAIAEEALAIPKAEILIATPGRLVDHINNGDYVKLSDVRYLVLDESDRLLEDSYQNWIDVLIPALGRRTYAFEERKNRRPIPRASYGVLNVAIRPDIAMKTGSSFSGQSQANVMKILASATQTRNPMRLYKLDLRNVCFFEPRSSEADEGDRNIKSGDRYTVPATMTERGWIVDSLVEKPTALLQLLGWIPIDSDKTRGLKSALEEGLVSQGGTKLVFTNSIDSAHRLCRLLELCAFSLGRNGKVLEMSGTLSAKRRNFVLDAVREKGLSVEGNSTNPPFVVVICSDVLARGMDILNVDTVINYDTPAHISTYLHRAGRTARAGRHGNVFTVLVSNQVKHFRSMVYEAERDNRKVKTIDLKIRTDGGSENSVIVRNLGSLRQVLRRERYGALHRDESLPEFVMHSLNRPGSYGTGYKYDGDDLHHDSENGEAGRKRRRTLVDDVPDADNDEQGDVNDASFLHEILYTQIGRNLLDPPSAG